MISDDLEQGTAPVLVVGAAIVDDLEHPTTLLSARRIEPPHLAGGWELPGGKVEAGERPEQALLREIDEELGVTVELGREIRPPDGTTWPLPPSAQLRVWLAVVVEGDLAPLADHDELRILSAGSWLDVAWLPADVPVVRALEALVAGMKARDQT